MQTIAIILTNLVQSLQSPTRVDTLTPPEVKKLINDPINKSALLTLHFLFPHEFLPALDLIDRKLITALRYCGTGGVQNQTRSALPQSHGEPHLIETFVVQSASKSNYNRNSTILSGRFRDAYNSTKNNYEVNLMAWNCSCPAFAYSTMKQLVSQPDLSESISQIMESPPKNTLLFGGNCVNPYLAVPICKHILAVYLTKSAPDLFGHGMQTDELSGPELAGWLND